MFGWTSTTSQFNSRFTKVTFSTSFSFSGFDFFLSFFLSFFFFLIHQFSFSTFFFSLGHWFSKNKKKCCHWFSEAMWMYVKELISQPNIDFNSNLDIWIVIVWLFGLDFLDLKIGGRKKKNWGDSGWEIPIMFDLIKIFDEFLKKRSQFSF